MRLFGECEDVEARSYQDYPGHLEKGQRRPEIQSINDHRPGAKQPGSQKPAQHEIVGMEESVPEAMAADGCQD